VGTGIEIDRLFLKLDDWPWGCVRNFNKNDFFPARNLVFRKKSATVGQFSKLKDFNKKTKVHTLFSGKMGQPLNYLIHDSLQGFTVIGFLDFSILGCNHMVPIGAFKRHHGATWR
jgi:hypothetical protein